LAYDDFMAKYEEAEVMREFEVALVAEAISNVFRRK
jgi:hypothetical protein